MAERVEGEGLFLGEFEPTRENVFRLLERGRSYNASVRLRETVNMNENFFVGKQWEGVQSNGLPTPVFNILKRDVCFVVSNITSDNLAAIVTGAEQDGSGDGLAELIGRELAALMEENDVVGLSRELARDAAVRGDGCLFTWWDPSRGRRGGIRTELIENTRVYFGNPNDRHVESQPYIIIESRVPLREARRRARENGFRDWEDITAEDGASDRATVALMLWRDEDSGEIMAFECTRACVVRGVWSLGIRRYPVVWMCWDYVQDSYHGQAMITGLIPNQIFINKAWAMSILSLMTTAYPKVIYDRTRIAKWDNRVGAAIGVNGGDMASVARIMDPAQVSPQIADFIELAIEQTNRNLGATSAALGDVKPENTSAIFALQRASATPSEITKQSLRRAVEELLRIYIEFIGAYYGVRETTEGETDFGEVHHRKLRLRVDVGAGAYYSEIAAMQTLDRLLDKGLITLREYLDRLPEGVVRRREELGEKGNEGMKK